MTNLACVVDTAIAIASWGLVAEMRRAAAPSGRDWQFMKAERDDAYKQPPLAWGQSELSVVSIRSPAGGRWYGFLSRALLYGAIAAAIRYNVVSRIISELMCRIFCIPMISYFDDCGVMIPKQIAHMWVVTFAKWRNLLGGRP